MCNKHKKCKYFAVRLDLEFCKIKGNEHVSCSEFVSIRLDEFLRVGLGT